MRMNALLQGPTIPLTTTDTIEAGITSGYEQDACYGPFICIEDTVFNAACVALHGSRYLPSTSKTYPAGMIVYKLLTTVKLTSGSVEMVPHGHAEFDLG